MCSATSNGNELITSLNFMRTYENSRLCIVFIEAIMRDYHGNKDIWVAVKELRYQLENNNHIDHFAVNINKGKVVVAHSLLHHCNP